MNRRCHDAPESPGGLRSPPGRAGWYGTCIRPCMPAVLRDVTARHLAVVLAVKFCLLGLLWWGFVRGAPPEPGADDVARSLLPAGGPAGTAVEETHP